MEIPQTNYGYQSNELIPKHKWIRYGPSNVSNVVFNASNSSQVVVKIPCLSAINLSRSYIQWNMTVPAGGAGLWTVVAENTVPFQSVQLQTNTALSLADIQYAGKYCTAFQPYRNSLEKGFLSGGNDIMTSNHCGFQPAQNNIQICSQDGLTTGNTYAGPLNYLDRQVLSFSNQPNTALTINKQIPLSTFVNTLLALDKTLFFPNELQLVLNLAPLYQVFQYVTNPQQPDKNVTLPNASITCSTFSLYLCIDTNSSIADNLKNAIAKETMKIPIPFVFNQVLAVPGSVTQSNLSFQISKMNGRQLNAVAFAMFNSNTQNLYNIDMNNTQGCKISSYITYMDSTQLQNGSINCFNPNAAYNPLIWTGGIPASYGDDFRVNSDFIKGSQILSYPQYQNQQVHWDAFGQLPFAQEDLNLNNMWWTSELSGLSLLQSGDHTYSMSFTCPGTSNAQNPSTNSIGQLLLVSCFFSRHLHVDSTGVYLSS